MNSSRVREKGKGGESTGMDSQPLGENSRDGLRLHRPMSAVERVSEPLTRTLLAVKRLLILGLDAAELRARLAAGGT